MNPSSDPLIGVVGSGVVGARVAITLQALGHSTRVAHYREASDLFGCRAVVVAHGGSHASTVSAFVGQGIPVVSTGDDLADVLTLLDGHERAVARKVPVVVGAACAPGMSGLLLSHVRRAFETVDEIHTAVHGTGGPLCAHQHHDSLAGTSIGWHDGEWLQQPAGSGRELCWFPDPVGSRDCYRYASPDPVLLQRAEPGLMRITSRVSATRRDRLTARLPMMTPPHPEGGVGGLRVEVRGVRDGKRHVEIVGIAERVATIAGAVAAHTVVSLLDGDVAPGVHNLGEPALANGTILDGVVDSGIKLFQFVGR